MHIEANSLVAGRTILRLGVTVREETWIKFHVVEFPGDWILDESITAMTDRIVRRELKRRWNAVDPGDGLW